MKIRIVRRLIKFNLLTCFTKRIIYNVVHLCAGPLLEWGHLMWSYELFSFESQSNESCDVADEGLIIGGGAIRSMVVG